MQASKALALSNTLIIMAVAGIHALLRYKEAWMAGTSQAKTNGGSVRAARLLREADIVPQRPDPLARNDVGALAAVIARSA